MSKPGNVGLGIVGVIVLAVAMILGRTVTNSVFHTAVASNTDVELRAAVARTAAEMEKQTPIRVDEDTTIISVVSVDKTIIYSNRISFPVPSAYVTQAKAKLIGNITSYVCSKGFDRRILEAGGAYKYVYADSAGQYVMDFTIDKGALLVCSA